MPESAEETSTTLRKGSRFRLHFESILLILLVALGAGLRIARFLTTGSLWHDEACLALNIVSRHAVQLFKPLAYDQAAAPGFLLIEKFLIHFVGASELVVRFPALLSSVAVLILIGLFCKAVFSEHAALLATCLLAVSPLAISFCSDLKPYATDAALTAWMLIVFSRLLRTPERKGQWTAFCVWGIVALLLSQSIIFVLLSLSLAVLIAFRRNIQSLIRAVVTGSIWLVIFATFYLLIYRFEGNSLFMQSWWSPYVLAIRKPGVAARAKEALYNLLPRSIDILAFLHQKGLIVLVLLGLYFVWKRAGVVWLAALAVPYLLVVLASAVGVLPIFPRLLLFAIPLLATLIAVGVDSILSKLRSPMLRRACCTLLVVALATYGMRLPLPDPQDQVTRRSAEMIAHVLHAPNCDAAYVFASSIPVWAFYTRGFDGAPAPTNAEYQALVDHNHVRTFSVDTVREAAPLYHLGCKPLVLGELPPREFKLRAPFSRPEWARAELERIKRPGAKAVYVYGDMYHVDDLHALLDEAKDEKATVQTLYRSGEDGPYLALISF